MSWNKQEIALLYDRFTTALFFTSTPVRLTHAKYDATSLAGVSAFSLMAVYERNLFHTATRGAYMVTTMPTRQMVAPMNDCVNARV